MTSLANIVLSVLGAAGATLIITRSSLFGTIFSKLGLLKFQFFNCPMCIGFWVGIIFYAAPESVLFQALRFGCLVSGAAYLLVSVTDKLQEGPRDGL